MFSVERLLRTPVRLLRPAREQKHLCCSADKNADVLFAALSVRTASPHAGRGAVAEWSQVFFAPSNMDGEIWNMDCRTSLQSLQSGRRYLVEWQRILLQPDSPYTQMIGL